MGWIKSASYVALAAIVLVNIKDRRVYAGIVFAVAVYALVSAARTLELPVFRRLAPLPMLSVEPTKKRAYPHRVLVLGPPASGKTWLMENAKWVRAFGHAVNKVPELIDELAKADFYDKTKRAVCAYTFDWYLMTMRERDEADCRTDTSVTHVFDCNLIGSASYHIGCYVAGYHEPDRAQALFDRKPIAQACRPLGMDTEYADLPDLVVVYCGAPFNVCHNRIGQRKTADNEIEPLYHNVLVFVNAYLVLHVMQTYPHVSFLLDSEFPKHTATREDYKRGREAVRKAAIANLDVTLNREQCDRLLYATKHLYMPEDMVQIELKDGTVRLMSKTLRSAERVASVRPLQDIDDMLDSE